MPSIICQFHHLLSPAFYFIFQILCINSTPLVLICISIRASKVEHFLMPVYYLSCLFVDHLFVSSAHLQWSLRFSSPFSWAFCAILIETFPWYIWWKYFPQSACLFISVMIIILETCKHFLLRFIQFMESLECIILPHIWCLLFFKGFICFFLKLTF